MRKGTACCFLKKQQVSLFRLETPSCRRFSMLQGEADVAAGRANAVVIPSGSETRPTIVRACITSVDRQMAEDRKTTALKSLQVCTS